MAGVIFPLVAAVAVLAAGAVGLGLRAADADDVAERAYEALSESDSFRFAMDIDATGRSVPRGVGLQMQGVVDNRAGLSRFALTIEQLRAVCTYITSEPEEDLFVSVHPTRRQAAGAAWLQTDIDAMAELGSIQLRPDQFSDVDRYFEGDFERVGTANVRGVMTTRYRGRVDVSAIQSAVRSPAPSPAAQSAPADIYVDEQGRLRRQVFDTPAIEGVDVKTTIDFFDFDVGATVERPPAAAVKRGTANEAALACFPAGFGGAGAAPASNRT